MSLYIRILHEMLVNSADMLPFAKESFMKRLFI